MGETFEPTSIEVKVVFTNATIFRDQVKESQSKKGVQNVCVPTMKEQRCTSLNKNVFRNHRNSLLHS